MIKKKKKDLSLQETIFASNHITWQTLFNTMIDLEIFSSLL